MMARIGPGSAARSQAQRIDRLARRPDCAVSVMKAKCRTSRGASIMWNGRACTSCSAAVRNG